jgi:hypothetical protein
MVEETREIQQRRYSVAKVLSKTQAITVAILHVEVTTPIGLIADITGDGHAFGLELRVEHVRVVDPNVGVPGPLFRVGEMVGPHEAALFQLL